MMFLKAITTGGWTWEPGRTLTSQRHVLGVGRGVFILLTFSLLKSASGLDLRNDLLGTQSQIYNKQAIIPRDVGTNDSSKA